MVSTLSSAKEMPYRREMGLDHIVCCQCRSQQLTARCAEKAAAMLLTYFSTRSPTATELLCERKYIYMKKG